MHQQKAFDSALRDKFVVLQSKGIKYVEMLYFQSIGSQIVIISSFATLSSFLTLLSFVVKFSTALILVKVEDKRKCPTSFWWSCLCGLPIQYVFTSEVIRYSPVCIILGHLGNFNGCLIIGAVVTSERRALAL